MSFDKFNFSSPGVKIGETDNSRLPELAGAVGPVVIGRARKGPALRPVTVRDEAEFVEIFGEPLVSANTRDLWRSNTPNSPTMGAYAALAYLRNQRPVTFVRVLGINNDFADTATATAAGWTISNSPAATATAGNGGAWALVVKRGVYTTGAPNTIDVSTGDAYIAGIFYQRDGIISLEGVDITDTSVTNDIQTGQFVGVTAANATFGINFYDASDVLEKKIVVNLNEDSINYIRNKSNTDPSKVNAAINTSTERYWLGETYDMFLRDLDSASIDVLGDFDLTTNGNNTLVVAIVPLEGASFSGNEFEQPATPAETPWIISQHTGISSAYAADSNGEYPVEKLFRFVALESGVWESSNLKVSVANIKPSRATFNDYGTFDIEVRLASDNDNSKVVLETFTQVNLNPRSPDFIGVRVGDQYTVWNETEKKYDIRGDYLNQSKYVRVELNDDIKRGTLDPTLLPFGFYHPAVYNEVALSTSPVFETTINSLAGTTIIRSPKLKMRSNSNVGNPRRNNNVYWGIENSKATNFRTMDPSYVDHVRLLPNGLDPVEADGTNTEIPSIVSLDELVYTAATNTWAWTPGSRGSGTAYVVLNDVDALLTTQEQNKFTVPMVGGFDGVDVREREPFRNTLIDSSTEFTHYAYASLKRAVQTVADSEVVKANLLVMPGVTVESLTRYMIEVCEDRGDMMAIIDPKGIYKPLYEGTSETLPVISTVTANMKTRQLNSSYGSCYFPSMQARDRGTGETFWVPPSLVALGSYGYSDSITNLWIAPAGFTRGSLKGSKAGIAITNGRLRLTEDERDDLQAVKVNPIAYFKDVEDWVVFGAKTLQLDASALDQVQVRRMVNYIKQEFNRLAKQVLFDPNVNVTWNRFKTPASDILSELKSKFGLEDFKLILDETTTTPDLVDRNAVYGKVFLKPVKAIEFIGLDFNITNSGAVFGS